MAKLTGVPRCETILVYKYLCGDAVLMFALIKEEDCDITSQFKVFDILPTLLCETARDSYPSLEQTFALRNDSGRVDTSLENAGNASLTLPLCPINNRVPLPSGTLRERRRDLKKKINISTLVFG